MRSPILRRGGSSRPLVASTALVLTPLLPSLLAIAPATAAPAPAPAPTSGVPEVASSTFALDGLAALDDPAVGRSSPSTAGTRTVRIDVADGTQSVGLTWAGERVGEVEVRGIVAGTPTGSTLRLL